MNATESRPHVPSTGRLRVLVVLLTFLALCAAFVAGSLHQADANAEAHDAGTSVVQTVAPGLAGPGANDEVVLSPSGWLTGLATACALFVLLLLVRAKAPIAPALLRRPSAPGPHTAATPVLDVIPRLPALPISRT